MSMRKYPLSAVLVVAAFLILPGGAPAKEYPIGKPKTVNGMEVSAVYLQPIEMDPPGMMRAAAESDIHLEADIKAGAGNKNGFADGEWVPALEVHYELVKIDGNQTVSGELMPMVAN